MALCKMCGATDKSLFYASIATHCKEHWKARVRQNRILNIEHYRSFDKLRASLPHRGAARADYQKTEQGKAAHIRANKVWQSLNPKRKAASNAVNNAIRRGKMQKMPCFVCGKEYVEAHHADYNQPLSVTWLCVEHHKEIHWNMEKAA